MFLCVYLAYFVLFSRFSLNHSFQRATGIHYLKKQITSPKGSQIFPQHTLIWDPPRNSKESSHYTWRAFFALKAEPRVGSARGARDAEINTNSGLDALATSRMESMESFAASTPTRKLKRNFKLWILLSLLGLEASVEVYCRLPQQQMYGSVPYALTDRSADERDVLLIFPGAGGPDQYTDKVLNEVSKGDYKKGIKRYVRSYDWRQWRGNFLRASFDGQNVGDLVCSKLAAEQSSKGPIDSVHIVGVSVGSFAADSCINAFKRESTTSGPISTRLTLLDPFQSRGVFGYGWGRKNFGKNADVVVQVVNTDDVVPNTSDSLENAFVYDITGSKDRAKVSLSQRLKVIFLYTVGVLCNVELDSSDVLLPYSIKHRI